MFAVHRAADVITSPPVTGLSRQDQQSFEQLAILFDLKPGTSEYTHLRDNVVASTGKYYAYRAVTLLHVLPGTLILLMGLAQFSPWVRAHHMAFHRISGRVLLAAIIVAGLSGLFFGLVVPYGGMLESTATAFFGGFMLFAAARAFVLVRRRDIARHREWMIRMFSVAIGIAVMRMLAIVAVLVVKAGPAVVNPRATGLLLWVGWSLSLAVAELWIRRTRGGGLAAISLRGG
ncbi:MAG: DUF2306 domain-containing protein [Betaproteobacteria bacterium]|nr:DUF2306 domain-containing protein [Betaproteobacteria bacterium]